MKQRRARQRPPQELPRRANALRALHTTDHRSTGPLAPEGVAPGLDPGVASENPPRKKTKTPNHPASPKKKGARAGRGGSQIEFDKKLQYRSPSDAIF